MSGPAAELNTSTEEIAGLVERVTYFNEESGFAVLRVKVRGRRDQVTVLGPVPAISAGEWLTVCLAIINICFRIKCINGVSEFAQWGSCLSTVATTCCVLRVFGWLLKADTSLAV